MLSIVGIALRGFTLLFGAVVIGLSVTLAKQQHFGQPPSETSFGSFTGAFGILVALIGLASLWIDKIPAIIVMGLDGLASVFYLAGGIALTIALQSAGSCTANDDRSQANKWQNKILNGGCFSDNSGDVKSCGIFQDSDTEDALASLLTSRCQRAQADYVFEYLGFIFGLGVIALGFVLHRRGGTSHSYV